MVYTKSHDNAAAAPGGFCHIYSKESRCTLKAKEYILCHSALDSEPDLQIVFGEEIWCWPAGKVWSSVRDYFDKQDEYFLGLTMTMDSDNFWRVFRSFPMTGFVYQEVNEPHSRSPGLITIRVHIDSTSKAGLRHSDFLESHRFCEDSPGYWSYNLWSE